MLYLLGDGGLAILFVNGYVRVGGTQRAQGVFNNTGLRNNQIIAQWQVAYSGVSSSCSAAFDADDASAAKKEVTAV